MRNYFSEQIRSIDESRSLQLLGLSFSLVHLIIFLSGVIDNWWIPYFLSSDSIPICSALFENCYKYRFSFSVWQWIWCFYGVYALICPALFYLRKIKAAYYLLVVLTIFEIYVAFADYRLWYSHFYVTTFTILPFLFLKPKPLMSAVTMALCYWWAGWLKANHWWMSGLLLKDLYQVFPQWLAEQASFVVFMELGLVWLLFSKRPKIFWPIFGLFVLFHVLSWHVVGFFYPMLMFCLLPVFVFAFREKKTPWESFLKPANLAFLAGFCLLQIPPYFQSENSYLLGGGRMFYSLHMFHRHVTCRMEASYLENGVEKKIDLAKTVGYVGQRIACEPLVSFNIAKSLCRTQNIQAPMHVEHWSKFDGQEKDFQIYAVDDFCHQDLHMSFWGQNSWMKQPMEEKNEK